MYWVSERHGKQLTGNMKGHESREDALAEAKLKSDIWPARSVQWAGYDWVVRTSCQTTDCAGYATLPHTLCEECGS